MANYSLVDVVKAALRGKANGLAPLDSTSRVPVGYLASGTPDGTKFVRDDGTLASPPSSGSGSSNTGIDGGAFDTNYGGTVAIDGGTL